MNENSIIKLLCLIINIFLGSYVLIRSPRNKLNQSFFLITISAAIMGFGYFMLLLKPQMLIWTRIALFGQCLTSANSVLFSLIYGRKDFKKTLESRKFYIVLLYSISVIFSVGVLSGFVNFSILDVFPDYRIVFGNIGLVFILFILGCDLIALMNLEKTYRQVRHVARRIQYPAIVLIAAIAFRFLAYSLSIGYHYIQISTMVIVSITLVIANFCISFPVLRPEAKLSGAYVGREVVAKSYTLLLTGIYLLLIGLLGKIIQAIGENFSFFLSSLIAFFIIFVLMIIIMSKSLKKRFQSFIDRNFYRNKYDYRLEWENFSKKVFSTLNMKELFQQILNAISDTIGTESAFIMFLDERTKEFFVAVPDLADQGLADMVIPADNVFLDWLWRYGSPVIIENSKCVVGKASGNPPDIPSPILNVISQEIEKKSLFAQNFFCVPIITENNLIAIIILGYRKIEQENNRQKKKHSRAEIRYLQEDMDLLETMSSQISLAIMNSKRSKELALSRELESFNRLSSMLLHDLKNSASMLSLVIQNAANNFDNPEFQKDALSTLSNVASKIQKTISRLSSAPQEEAQRIEPVDLVETINRAISSSGIREMTRIKVVEKLERLPMLEFDPENIERVIQNLIINAIESIENEGTITIGTSQIFNEFVQISISDTGCGMSQEFIRERLFKPFQTTKEKGLGIGLYQCKKIIDSYDGVVDIHSQKGIGSIFTIKLPIGKAYTKHSNNLECFGNEHRKNEVDERDVKVKTENSYRR